MNAAWKKKIDISSAGPDGAPKHWFRWSFVKSAFRPARIRLWALCPLPRRAVKVDASGETELVGAALQGLLLDFHLWSDTGVEAQALLLEGVSSVVSSALCFVASSLVWFSSRAAATCLRCFLRVREAIERNIPGT